MRFAARWAARVSQNTSRACALCGVLLHHSFVVAGTLRVPLSQPQSRRIQPERYVPEQLKDIYEYLHILTKNGNCSFNGVKGG